MTDDLVTWLRGVLDEDERRALAANQPYHYAPGATAPATGVRWRWVAGEQWETVDLDTAEEFVAEPGHDCWLVTVEEWPNDYGRMMPQRYVESAVEVDVAAARLIARHDPASVLADIAAKRAILDLAAKVLVARDEKDATGALISVPIARARMRDVVRLLASAYSDRPGYQEEWRP